MITFDSYNEYHIGDNLVHLNFLRRMARAHPQRRFRHALHRCYIKEVSAVVADVPNVELLDIEVAGKIGRNGWKNADGYWERSEWRWDWANFHLTWFALLAREMGLSSEIQSLRDLLFDYPQILSTSPDVASFWMSNPCFDVLVVNSQPCSGQFMDFKEKDDLAPLIEALLANGLKVLCTDHTRSKCACTRDWNLNISQIGGLSLLIPHHVMIATGPMWPTFNIWNTLSTKLRLVMLGNNERLNLPVAIEQAATKAEAFEVLQRKGLL